MKHITYLFISALLIIGFCTGCGKSGSSAGNNEITFWHFWSEPAQKKVINELISDFEKENNCKVNISELSWNDGKIKLFASFNSNTAPDVLELGSDWIAQFSHSGILSKLDGKAMNIQNFENNFTSPGYFNGNLYAIPWVVNTRLIFYNNELFKKAGIPADSAPRTLDKMLQYAERISQIKNAYGFGVNGSDPHRLYKKIMPFIWTYGGDIFDSTGNLSLNSPAAIRAFEFYQNLSRVGIIETQKKIDDMFARGQIGMWISGTWLIDKIKAVNPFLNYGVALFPGETVNKPGTSFAGAEYLAINKSSKNQQLAKKLIKYLSDGQNALRLCKQVKDAGFPADKQYYSDKYFSTLPFIPTFIEQLKHSKLTPCHPQWLDIESALEDALVEVLYGKKMAPNALEEIQEELSAKVKKLSK